MTTEQDPLAARFERVRTLVRRLSRVRNSSIEAELIAQLALETEAINRMRAADQTRTGGLLGEPAERRRAA
jgi:hypothetical protein